MTTLADPPVLHTVAAQYGALIAAGDLSPAGAEAALARICNHHPRVTDFDGSLQRAIATCLQAAYANERSAAQDIRLGLQPFLHRRAPSQALHAEAYRLSAARLLRPDCDAIVRQEIAAFLQRPAGEPRRSHGNA